MPPLGLPQSLEASLSLKLLNKEAQSLDWMEVWLGWRRLCLQQSMEVFCLDLGWVAVRMPRVAGSRIAEEKL